jgi:hypothetical protein
VSSVVYTPIMLAASWDVVGDVVLVTGLVLSCASLVPQFLRRKQPRCPTCSYDLTGVALTPIPKCPECGKLARSTRRLFRGRVQLRLLACGVVLSILCNVPYSVPRVEKAGWVGVIPTTALALWYPYFTPDRGDRKYEQNGPVEAEFVRRFISERNGSDYTIGPIVSRVVALRCELAFRMAGRWDSSAEERSAISNFKGDIPELRADRTESITDYIQAISTATGRQTSIDAEGFREAGLNPATLRNATRTQQGYEIREIGVQSEHEGTTTTKFAYPVCFRGTVVLTPRPAAYACVMAFPPLPGATARSTANLLSWATNASPQMMRTMYGAIGGLSIEEFGNRIVIYGAESSVAAAQHAYTTAAQPPASPWAPTWFVDVTAARRTFDTLNETLVPEAAVCGTFRQALAAISLATGIKVELCCSVDERATLLDSPITPTATMRATKALDRLARNLGDFGCWDISPKGEVELAADETDFRKCAPLGIVAIYDTPGLNDVPDFPYDDWEGLLMQLPRDQLRGYGGTVALRQSRYALLASLVFHMRLEGLLRPKFQERSAD